MLEVQDELEQFISRLKKTQVYKEYIEQKDKINEYPELKKQIDEYRQKNFELQTKSSPQDLYDEVDRFEKEYEQLRAIPMVNDYLSSELAFCRMLQEISENIIEAISPDFE